MPENPWIVQLVTGECPAPHVMKFLVVWCHHAARLLELFCVQAVREREISPC
jgi:hypothetical protein